MRCLCPNYRPLFARRKMLPCKERKETKRCLVRQTLRTKNRKTMGSGSGSVGRAVASDARGLQFESSHQQNFKMNIFTVSCWHKTRTNTRSIKHTETGINLEKRKKWQRQIWRMRKIHSSAETEVDILDLTLKATKMQMYANKCSKEKERRS